MILLNPTEFNKVCSNQFRSKIVETKGDKNKVFFSYKLSHMRFHIMAI